MPSSLPSPLDLAIADDPPLRLIMAYTATFPGHAPELVARVRERELAIALHLHAPEPLQAARFVLQSAEMGAESPVTFTWQSAKTRRGLNGRPLPRWARYAAGIILALDFQDDAPGAHGFSAVVSGTEPIGPRYEFAVGLLFSALLNHWRDPAARETPAAALMTVERVRRDYVGDGT